METGVVRRNDWTTTLRRCATATMLFFSTITHFSASSSSTSRYSPYNYDRTTPMFTPDGRLLQVEYAGRASEHSSPIVGVVFPMINDDEDDEEDVVLVVACRSSSGRRRARRRLVVVGDGAVVTGASGVLPDCASLSAELRKETDARRRAYGDETSSAAAVARIVGDACARRALGGGIRPFGASVLACAADGAFEAFPSGAVTEHRPDGDGVVVAVSGGSEARRRRLRKTVRDELTSPNDGAATARRVVETVLRELSADYAKHDAIRNGPSSSAAADEHGFEIVVVTQRDGAYFLDDDEVRRILSKDEDENKPNAT